MKKKEVFTGHLLPTLNSSGQKVQDKIIQLLKGITIEDARKLLNTVSNTIDKKTTIS